MGEFVSYIFVLLEALKENDTRSKLITPRMKGQ